MPAAFDLIIDTDSPSHTAEFRLLDAHANQLAYRQTDFTSISVSRRLGLFDLRNYLRNLVEPGHEAASVAEIGVCIAEEVLGVEIFRTLWKSIEQRTLRIKLPGATEEEDHLAAALARVPWEIARPAADQPTLGERNLLVRVVHDTAATATQPLALNEDESLRVLIVFAEARGSRPLAARLERLELNRLFVDRIYPKRRVVADFLTHGVTRERLEEQIRDRGGYHVMHWSGHGHLNRLELAKPGGDSDYLSGDDLLNLFTDAGGFIPRLVFLSACHSGDILRVKDWSDFLALAQGKERGTKESATSEEREIPVEEQPGYTGTAHALIQGGVPSVVAMRYAVGDEYARELAVHFYDALLADAQPKSAAAALMIARKALLKPGKHTARYAACDHATPVLYGEEQPGLILRPGRSPALDTRNPRLHQIAELTTAGHEHFVGRTWELAGLGAEFIGSSTAVDIKPVALITGLGGMGKTALVAEALGLWESRFQWVLLYQAKPNALAFEATLRDVHMKLYGELGRYHQHVQSHPADAIYRPADAEFTGPERLDRLIRNLVCALRDEAILLVLDNFETNLKPKPESASADGNGEPLWACQDPAWDRCLSMLAEELPGTPSRVLITCRRPLAALAGACHRILLGPLPSGEAALYLREHRGLREMVFGGDPGEKALALRLLAASRFHPLLMDRLARLATGDPTLRSRLMQALAELENRHDFSALPALFATAPGDTKELAYLNDALATSLDHLIRDANPDARRLLWIIAIANEPVTLKLLKSVWSGESHEQHQLRQIKEVLDMLPLLPTELQLRLQDMPLALRARVDALSPTDPGDADPAPLLRYLIAVGLVTEERTGPDDDNPDVSTHELIRERIHAWMRDHAEDRGDLTDNSIRLVYVDHLVAVFKALQHRNMAAAIQAGSHALVYCVQAGDYNRLSSFASSLVTGTNDSRLLTDLLPHLEAAAASAPEGEPQWSCFTYLADALLIADRPEASISFYEQAATLARSAAEVQGEGGRHAWSDLAWITGNWALALRRTGNADASRQRYLDSAEAGKKAGRPAIHAVATELNALRIDIQKGGITEALPQVELRLAQVEGWWRQHRSGQLPSEAPTLEFVARVFIGALDIAREAHMARNDWKSALLRIDTILDVQQALERPAEDIARNRMNRAVVLGNLGGFGEARTELEYCLEVFQHNPGAKAATLSSLAQLFSIQGDASQAITQERRARAIRGQKNETRARDKTQNNLALYIEQSGTPAAFMEAENHRLIDLIYVIVSDLGKDLPISISNYTRHFSRALTTGIPLTVPRVAELLANPAFHPLETWLRQRDVDIAKLQTTVDQLLEQARQAAIASQDAPPAP
jgi:tetratricopeptide (TPR) repeat protein